MSHLFALLKHEEHIGAQMQLPKLECCFYATVLMTTFFAAVCADASAQGFPIRAKEGRVAPHGYSRSGDYYVPSSRNARTAIPKRDGEVCPHGYAPSGGACLSNR